jgi:hypothetical protein
MTVACACGASVPRRPYGRPPLSCHACRLARRRARFTAAPDLPPWLIEAVIDAHRRRQRAQRWGCL